MTTLKILDDVRFPKKHAEISGVPILHNNIEIRKMLKLARIDEHDVFFDLGCGYGQNLIIAVTEFGVRKAFGIESCKKRVRIANDRIRRRKLQKCIKIIHANFDDLVEGKISKPDIKDATVVFYALESDALFIKKLIDKLSNKCKLLYDFRCLLPEIKPNATDFPFYMSKKPFKRPNSEKDWLESLFQKSFNVKKYTTKDLWNELYHDYEIERIRKYVDSYKKRLRKFLSNKS